MDSLRDLLADHMPDEPVEIRAIKHYVHEQFQREVTVSLRDNQVIIHAGSAPLANALRLRTIELRRLAGAGKQLIIRSGH